MQLRDDAVAAAWAIDRDQRLDVELEGVADPNHAGTDGAAAHPFPTSSVRHQRLQVGLHQRNQVIDGPYLKLYSRSRPEGVHSGRNRVFSDRRFACIGCGKPCGPYRASPWRWPAASSSAKSPACRTCRRGLSGGRRRIRGIAEAGTRRLPIDPDARARRDLAGRLSESRAAGQQGQDSDDRKDSTDFHGNVPSLNRIRRPARRMTASEAPACLGNARQRRNLRRKARKPWSSFVLVLRDDDRSRRAEQIGEAGADGID